MFLFWSVFSLHIFHVASLEGTTHQCVILLLDFMSWPWLNTSEKFGKKQTVELRAMHSHGSDGDSSPTSVFSCTKLLFMHLKQNHSFLVEVLSGLDVNKLCASRCNDRRNVMTFRHCMVLPCTLLRELQLSAQEDNIIMPEILLAY